MVNGGGEIFDANIAGEGKKEEAGEGERDPENEFIIIFFIFLLLI